MYENLNIEENFEDNLEDNLYLDKNVVLYENHRIIVDKGQTPIRIDKFLSSKIENASRNKIQQACEANCIIVNNIPVKSNYKIKSEDIIIIYRDTKPQVPEIKAENIPLNIIYEDEQLLVVNKPAGMVVHPAFGNYSGTLVNALAYYLKNNKMFDLSQNYRPGLVHRIDKDTSGLLLIAKTENAKNKLAKQFFDHSIERKYYAMVWGDFAEDSGTIIGNIGRNPKNRKLMYVFNEDEGQGKHAVTHYKVIERFGYVTLIECQLETGRTHQIRVHMKWKGHPLFNDIQYSGNQILRGTTFTKYKQFIDNCFKILPRQALHAKTIGFIHPATKKQMIFDSKLPNDMENLTTKWRNYVKVM